MSTGPPCFIHFFDWFYHDVWREDSFDDPLDWGAVGTSLRERGSVDFYRRQFEFIRGLGVGNIAWEHFEFNPLPIPAMVAMRHAGLRIAPFFDYELAYQHQAGDSRAPVLSPAGSIAPNEATLSIFRKLIDAFFASVPSGQLARDRQGNFVAFVYGYGFSEKVEPERWAWFATELVAACEPFTGPRVKFYWTTKQSEFQEYLFLRRREHFAPFQFVNDTPQSQCSRGAVTWNLGFDNDYVRRTYGLPRVVREDPRYVEETAWLAHAADPPLVFIYGWNEPFEGSMAFPTQRWGTAKSRLVRYYLERLAVEASEKLPRALVVVDDPDDWFGQDIRPYVSQLRRMLLYGLRRFVPQGDTVLAREVTPASLAGYALIVDATISKPPALARTIRRASAEGARVLLFEPVAGAEQGYASAFFSGARRLGAAAPARVRGTETTLLLGDDSLLGRVVTGSRTLLWAELEDGTAIPLVVYKGAMVFVNHYAYEDTVWAAAFEALYDRPMEQSILYGEMHSSQRLEQYPDGTIVRNRFERRSVNERWRIPESVIWSAELPNLSSDDIDFAFGRR